MDEDDDDFNDPDVTEEKLSALNHERQVMEISLVEQTQKLLTEAAPGAALQIVTLATNATNENIKFNASKYIVDRVLDPDSDAGKGLLEDVLGDLVKSAEKIANGGNI